MAGGAGTMTHIYEYNSSSGLLARVYRASERASFVPVHWAAGRCGWVGRGGAGSGGAGWGEVERGWANGVLMGEGLSERCADGRGAGR